MKELGADLVCIHKVEGTIALMERLLCHIFDERKAYVQKVFRRDI